MEKKIIRRLKINSVTAIIWFVLGIMAYLSLTFMPKEALDNLPPDDSRMIYTLPQWFYVSYSVAVFAGFIGSVALFLQKKISILFFGLSLLGTLGILYYKFTIDMRTFIYGSPNTILALCVLIVVIGLLVYSYNLKKKGVLI